MYLVSGKCLHCVSQTWKSQGLFHSEGLIPYARGHHTSSWRASVRQGLASTLVKNQNKLIKVLGIPETSRQLCWGKLD